MTAFVITVVILVVAAVLACLRSYRETRKEEEARQRRTEEFEKEKRRFPDPPPPPAPPREVRAVRRSLTVFLSYKDGHCDQLPAECLEWGSVACPPVRIKDGKLIVCLANGGVALIHLNEVQEVLFSKEEFGEPFWISREEAMRQHATANLV